MSLLDKFKKKKESPEIKKDVKDKNIKDDSISDKKKEIPEKKLSKSDMKRKSLGYNIIKEPCITEKATFLAEQNKYVFKVYPNVNKIEVKKAIESIYNSKVANVHIIHVSPKRRRLGRREGWRNGLKKGFKKAIVTLKKGEKIELMPR